MPRADSFSLDERKGDLMPPCMPLLCFLYPFFLSFRGDGEREAICGSADREFLDKSQCLFFAHAATDSCNSFYDPGKLGSRFLKYLYHRVNMFVTLHYHAQYCSDLAFFEDSPCSDLDLGSSILVVC